MISMGQETTDVELATLKEQLKTIQLSLDEVKDTLKKVLEIDRTVAEVRVRQEVIETDLSKLSIRAEVLEKSQATGSAYMNKVRGGVSIATFVLSALQAVVLAGGSWLLNSVVDTRSEVRVLKQTVRHLELEQDRLYSLSKIHMLTSNKEEGKNE